MFMRDFMVNDRLVDIPDLWKINGSFLMYKEGESLVRYMAKRFGDESLRALIDSWWKADRFDLALRNTLGMTVEELNRDWKRYLKRRYWPSVMQSDWPSVHGEALTRRAGINTRPAVLERSNPENWEFAFLSSASGNIDLMRATRGADGRFRFETVVESGRNGRFESMPAFASGLDALGDVIAFTAKSGGQDALFVWDMSRDRELARYRFDSLIGIYSPTWSPDGRQLAFVGLDRRGWTDLYRVSIDTGNLVRLTEDPAHDRDPDWSPDGERLVWSSDRDAPRRNGIYHIQMLDLHSGVVTRLTQGEADDASPCWSPSGDRLLLSSDRSGANNIHLYEFDTATLTQLTSTLGGLFTPRWVGNGREFLATSFSNLSFNIYRFDLDRIERLPDRKPPLVQVATMGSPLPRRQAQRPTHWLQDSAGDRFPKNDYDVKFGVDFVRGAVGFDPDFSNGAAAQLGFTDVLGNHRISLLFANSAQSFDSFFRHLSIGATYTNMSHRLHYTLGAFHLTRSYDPNLDVFRYERRTGVLAGLTLPLSRFRRIEQTVVVRSSQLEEIDAVLMGVKPNSVLLSTYTSFVHDNTMWAWYGPVKGTRFNITVGRTFDPSGAGRGSRSAHLDYRHYRALPGRSVFASRLSGHGNWGGEFQNFFLGGPFDLRGFDRRALFSRTLVLLNQELRFPLLDRLLIGLPVAPLEFGGFRGALFNDVAWVGRPFPGWYGAYGVGIEMNLGFGFITRWNTGNTHDFHTTLDRFSRFFLGWNF
jgi:WD40 repeat protein